MCTAPFHFASNVSLLVQGLDAPSSEVISLVSHATQDRLKTLVSKLSVIAEHRLDVIKTEGPYEVTDVSIGNARYLPSVEHVFAKGKTSAKKPSANYPKKCPIIEELSFKTFMSIHTGCTKFSALRS